MLAFLTDFFSKSSLFEYLIFWVFFYEILKGIALLALGALDAYYLYPFISIGDSYHIYCGQLEIVKVIGVSMIAYGLVWMLGNLIIGNIILKLINGIFDYPFFGNSLIVMNTLEAVVGAAFVIGHYVI